MRIGRRQRHAALAVACASLLAPASASAAQQHVVDDDRLQCPSAGYTTIAAAVAAAAPGDTVSVCDGTYREGTAGAGTTALTIDKPLTLKGAGAGRVYVTAAGDVAAAAPVLRDGAGNIVSVVGTEADISGMTIFGGTNHVEAGLAYVNSQGTVSSVEIVDTVRPGQYTGTSGVGFVSAADGATGLLNVTLEDSLVESYDAAGVLIDATPAAGGLRPSSATGVFTLLTGNRIMGAGGGGGVAGQDGIRMINRTSAVVVENTITDNSDAGIDILNSHSTSQTRFNYNNVQRNRVGLRHEAPFTLCTAGPNTAPENVGLPNRYRIDAVLNWWGSPQGPSTDESPGRGDSVNGDPTRNAGCGPQPRPADTTDRVDYSGFLTRPAPVPTPLGRFQDMQPTVNITSPADGTALVPGGTIQIAADAMDDIGVHSVTFMRGDQVLGVDTTAPYTATYTPQGEEAWSAQTIVAIATDSRGQTGADSVALGGGDDAPPFVELFKPTKLKNGGYELYAIADDDRGVEKVTFFLDGKRECADREAPYTCKVKPRFVPNDRLTVVAIATDTQGQTSSAIGTIKQPNRLKPRRLSLRADTQGRDVFAFGELKIPRGVRPKDGCQGSRVEVALMQGGDEVDSARVRLGRDCEYTGKLRGRRGERYRVTARFLGNDLLRSIKAKAKRVEL